MSQSHGSRVLRTSALAATLGGLALGATGRFRPALALTLGAVVAIVSARWLSLVVGRLQGTGAGEGRKPGWKFALGAGLRYLFVGVAVYGAVRLVPAEPVWLVTGLSSVVFGIVVEGLRDLWRERKMGIKGKTVRGSETAGRTGERI